MPLTEDFTFRLGDTGVVLNTSPSLPFVDVTKVVGLSSTPYRETERQHEGVDGGFMDVEFEKGRHVILEGTIYATADGMEDYLDDLKEDFAPSTSLVPFYFLAPGQAERLLFVKPLGIMYDWDTFRRLGAADCQFRMFAEDPRIYTSALQTVNVDVNFPSNVSGFEFDFGFNFTFGAEVLGNAESITVGGNRPTPPTFVITANGETVNPRIINHTTGRELDFSITLNDGDTLQIDAQRRTVLLNGTANRRSALIVDEWFFLEPGVNVLGFRSDSVDTSVLSVLYRDAWR